MHVRHVFEHGWVSTGVSAFGDFARRHPIFQELTGLIQIPNSVVQEKFQFHHLTLSGGGTFTYARAIG